MTEIKWFVAFAVVLNVVMFVLSFAGKLSPVAGLGFILVSMAVLWWWVSYRLHLIWAGYTPEEKATNKLVNDLRWMFAAGAAFWTIDVIPHVVLVILGIPVEEVTIVHWTGHILLFLYNILAVRIAVSFFDPRWKNAATIFVGIVSLIALTASALHPDFFVTIPGSAYPLLHSDPTYAAFNMASNIFSVGLFGLYLIVKGLLEKDRTVRIRALLMGVGIAMEVPGGFFIQYGSSPYTPLYIYVTFTLWALLTGISAIYSAKQRVAAPAPAPSSPSSPVTA
jgi:hypothetical protein